MRSLFIAVVIILFASGCSPSTEVIDKDAVFARYDWWDSREFGWYEDRIPFIDTPDEQINEV